MTFAVHGIAVARGIAIGRAVVVASGRADVAHYFIQPAQVEAEIERVRVGRNAVVEEIHRLQQTIAGMGPKEAPHELAALLDVHLMLLQDEELISGVKHWITDRLYNAEWALTTQLEVLSRQFDEMEDEYLRERKADLEQVAERILRYMKGIGSPVAQPPAPRRKTQQDLLLDDSVDVPLVLVAHDLSPADMLQFKQSVFAGFVTDVGGKTSHTAIVARSLDIPAVVGARSASQLVRQDDWVIIDGDAGVMIVDPSPIILAEYGFKQRQAELERGRLGRLRHTPAVTLDGQKVELLANIELPEDAAGAAEGRRRRRGPVPQRVPVHGPQGQPARRGRAVPGLPPRRRRHAGPAGHHPHRGRRRRQAAGRIVPRCGAPESGAGPARDPLEPGRARRCSARSCAPSCAPPRTARSTCWCRCSRTAPRSGRRCR